MRFPACIPMMAALAPLVSAPAATAQVNVCPGDTEGAAGDTVYVSILIDSPLGIDAFSFQLLYDPEFLKFGSALPSQLTTDWVAFDGNETSPGAVNVGGFHTTPISASSPDTLGYLCMPVVRATQVSSYLFTSFQDDLAGAPDCSGDFNPVNPVAPESWGGLKDRYLPARPPED